jgi:hypothetical protein
MTDEPELGQTVKSTAAGTSVEESGQVTLGPGLDSTSEPTFNASEAGDSANVPHDDSHPVVGARPTIAGYEIEREIGRGGMDVVYQARLFPVVPELPEDLERASVWTEVLTGLRMDSHGTIQVLDNATWRDRSQRLVELGGPPTL